MKLPSKGPKVELNTEIYKLLNNTSLSALFIKAQQDYYNWDKVKYIKLPEGTKPEIFWSALKIKREMNYIHLQFGYYHFNFCNTPDLQKLLHDFDLNFGGSIGSESKINEADKNRYLVSSIMEEAIASSKIEGAVTTRKRAKEMLLHNRKPVDVSEKMIMNNYLTIQHIRQIKHEPLTLQLLLEIQGLITADTLEGQADEGQLRTDNEVKVVDTNDGAIMHEPPSAHELEKLLEDLFSFFNTDDDDKFIHPIVKACIIHFLIGFIHPFVDGNGRTARALFYWYMLKHNYWLTEYLSISGIIYKSKVAYGKAYLDTEIDNNDLTYFIKYKMHVLEQAYKSLQEYLHRKQQENKASLSYARIRNINDRQSLMIQWLKDEPERILTVPEIELLFKVANQTARNDLDGLVKIGLVEILNNNRKTKSYARADKFESVLNSLS